MEKPNPGAIYNIADDEPAPPQDVVAYAAELLGIAPPPLIDFEDADLSPMARSFYLDSKQVSNAKIKSELGISLKFPTYREGLAALLDGEIGI
jgi:nucleoside-diphosphate-sugar epimerase